MSSITKFFVEIGVADFDTCEGLIENGWQGIMVEPVPIYFDKLPRHPGIIYENIAIDSKSGSKDIYYVDPKFITNKETEWLKGIGSLEGKGGPFAVEGNVNFKPVVEHLTHRVRTQTLQELCDAHGVKHIDLLKIDTEGHDFVVLKSLDLEKVSVTFIKMEHKHIDRRPVVSYLEKRGYTVWVEKNDLYAVR